jgi:long-chain acyl-CoA synthetase
MPPEDRELLENSTAGQLWDWLAQRYSNFPLSPDTDFELDLGTDSLEWFNITMQANRTLGVNLSDEVIQRVRTVRDLLREVTYSGLPDEAVKSSAHPFDEVSEETLPPAQKALLEPPGPVIPIFERSLFVLNRLLTAGIFRLRARGLDNIPDHKQFIFTPNHVSYLDPFMIACAFSFNRMRSTYWAGLTEAAFANVITRAVSRLAKTIAISPEKGAVSGMVLAGAVIRRGYSLVWFPEGGRSPDGRLQSFKPGLGILLDYFNIPVVPVHITGTYRAMPVGRAMIKPVTVTVIFGKPLTRDALRQKGRGNDAHQQITQGLYEHMRQQASSQ